jgi:hypothetical protein
LSSVKASRNFALVSGGIIQGLTGSYFELLNSYLSDNYADQGSCIYLNNPAKDNQIKIDRTKFINNNAGGNLMQIIYAYNLTIKNS